MSSTRAPNPLLAGLGAGLLLFGLTLCTVGIFTMPALARVLNIGGSSDQTWSPPEPIEPTPTLAPAGGAEPTLEPAPTAEATPTIALPTPSGPQTFQIGDTAMNINDGAVNLRKTPGYQNKPASDRITLVPQGERLLIVGGPAEADGLVWWNVEWQGQNGWMAETRASGGRILAPATPQ